MVDNESEPEEDVSETSNEESSPSSGSTRRDPVAGSNPLDRTVPGATTDDSSEESDDAGSEQPDSTSPGEDNDPQEAPEETEESTAPDDAEPETAPEESTATESNDVTPTETSEPPAREETSEPAISADDTPAEDETIAEEPAQAGQDMYESLGEFRELPLFENLGPEAIQAVVDGANQVTLREGETLFEEGDSPNENFYIILDGEVKIMKFMRTRTTQVTILTAGNYLGEFGMFTGNDRMAGAEANTTSEVLEIPRVVLADLKESHPEALATMYENMFGIMAKRFKALAEKAEKSQFWL